MKRDVKVSIAFDIQTKDKGVILIHGGKEYACGDWKGLLWHIENIIYNRLSETDTYFELGGR